ncbi:MAG TPA: GTPase domain-containing protein, partial [Urbifossiella sp.]|nr:GTPase domain-containing protein [Urbifossiella sp.]
MSRVWRALRRVVSSSDGPPPDLDATLAELLVKTPAPVFWMLGKTQSGKTSIIHYLTGADDAAIGSGFRPCTRTSRRYQFPSPESPLLEFLDTRGVDEPGYDPTEDIAAFNSQAHVIVVTAKATDFAQGNIRNALEPIRKANLGRPVILCVTCLNEAIPRQPHPQPYPFDSRTLRSEQVALATLERHIDEHRRAFAG